MKTVPAPDCLYVCGDSWTHGSELIDPECSNPDQFAAEHDAYRRQHYWPQLVADQLNLELIDGSHPGASNDRILRVSMYDLARLVDQGRRPFAVIAWSHMQRFELPEGPRGEFWRSFVSPNDHTLPAFVREIWKKWSSDRSDLVKWLQQIISLDAFVKVNNLDYITTCVFKENYWQLERTAGMEKADFKPYISQIIKHVNFNRHFLNISLETYLSQQANVTYGPGGHPLAEGHRLLAEQFLAQINSKFQFQRPADPILTT